jgi:hypothetical protein
MAKMPPNDVLERLYGKFVEILVLSHIEGGFGKNHHRFKGGEGGI